MPVVRDVPVDLETGEILRRAGVRQDSKLKYEIGALLEELLVMVRESHLLEPAVAYEIHSVSAVGSQQLVLDGGAMLQGQSLSRILSQARELAVAVCTIGSRLEERVAECFSGNEPLRALLLDGLGSAAVDAVVQEACELIMREASGRGYETSSPLSPGGPGFPLSEQWSLFKLVPAEKIGVSLTSSGLMVPRKSVSMVIGIGAQMTTWTKAEACARCNLSETCRYRIRG